MADPSHADALKARELDMLPSECYERRVAIARALAETRELAARSLEERILALEEKFKGPGQVPGTQLVRVLAPEKGIRWCLALGRMAGYQQPMCFFYGETIEEALASAESEAT